MTALATQADPRFVPSLLDAPHRDSTDVPRPNYTVETLSRLRASLAAESGADRSYLLWWVPIAGWTLDSGFRRLACWRFPTGLSRLGQVFRWMARKPRSLPKSKLSAVRCDTDAANHASGSLPACDLTLHHADAAPTRVWFLPDLQEDISATELRAALDRGQPDPELLPAPVRNYIPKTTDLSRPWKVRATTEVQHSLLGAASQFRAWDSQICRLGTADRERTRMRGRTQFNAHQGDCTIA